MKISEYIERLKLIQKLVQEEKTGSPDELANRLGVSRGTLYSLIDELQSHNVSISYSRKKQSVPVQAKNTVNRKNIFVFSIHYFDYQFFNF